ncbi:glycosyltransferase family 2 protein [Candidatus Azambacteria bacterium]|nr:glycosyltransferase family 2 protein [Candidatus Azambacteria bacterium]
MSEKKPKLSIIVNHYKTPDVLRVCLDSIRENVFDIPYEVLVTDSETDKIVKKDIESFYPEIFFIEHEKNVGFSKIVNDAIKAAKGEFLFIINADIVFKDKESIKILIDHMERHNDIGVLGPKLFNIDGSLQHTYFRDYTFLTILARRTFFGKTKFGGKILNKFTYKEMDGASDPFDVKWLMGSAYLVKKSVMERFPGYFDERFFMYFEDVDFCERMRRNGLRIVYFPGSEFTHYHSRASYGGYGSLDIFSNKMARAHIKSYLKYLWKWRFEQVFKYRRPTSIKNKWT